MTAQQLVDKAVHIAKNYKTLYVMGCFGAPLTGANVQRYCNNHSYNRQPARSAMVRAAGNQNPPVYGFDCVNLIKGILWGWSGDADKTYGGAKYATNGVPDTNADGMISRCLKVSTVFDNLDVGEALWCKGHIGLYIGNGLAVECTPNWENGVQITAVSNIGTKKGYPARRWTKHGRLPYVTYAAPKVPQVKKPVAAMQHDPQVAKGKVLTVNTGGLNIRYGPNKDKYESIRVLPRGTKVTWYGFYTGSWLLVQLADGTTGYCHKAYLR